MKSSSIWLPLLVFLAWMITGAAALADPVPCTGSDLSSATTAQSDAKGSLDSAIHFLAGGDAKTLQLVARWFGQADPASLDKVTAVLSQTSDWVSKVALYCIYENDGTLVKQVQAPDGSITLVDQAGDTYAYVDPGDLTKVNLGLAFFQAPATGIDSQLGTIIHEVTHFFITGNTQDVQYDQSKCLALAQSDPAGALANADNYEYFVEEWLSGA